jgi:hypothetical protein
VKNFFKSIGSFLNNAEDYFDYRVRTGKYIGDIKILLKEFRENTAKITKSLITKGMQSQYYIAFAAYVQRRWERILAVPVLEWTITMSIDGVKILIKYYAEIFIFFAITFPSVILLLNFFQTATSWFFIVLIPILLANLYFISVLYYVIDRREKGEKLSIWSGFKPVTKKFFPLSHIFLFQLSLFILVSVSFSILALFFRFFFEALAVPWSGSFIYWFFVIFIGLLFVIGVLIITVILHQAFFMRLFEEKDTESAVSTSLHFTQTYLLQFFISYVFLYLSFSILIYWAGLYYLYLGAAVSLFLFFYGSLLLGFLLRRKFYAKLPQQNIAYKFNIKQLFTIVVVFGFVNYTLASVVVTRQFNYITGIIETQRDNYFLNQELARYTNSIYRFTVEYPQSWNIYEWRDSSVTFYNNYTGTLTGGIWLNISVAPYDERNFLRLYNARPGLISLDPTTNNATTKVSNLSIQGSEGVNYTTFEAIEPYPEYQTHYMIRKNGYIYEITFTTLDKDVEGNNTELFERIVGSFRFIE